MLLLAAELCVLLAQHDELLLLQLLLLPVVLLPLLLVGVGVGVVVCPPAATLPLLLLPHQITSADSLHHKALFKGIILTKTILRLSFLK
jgi:hypothetical protein